ncbi:glycosyltransferase [Dendronalium sp. ChiSLP03b]|uniref:glycosyltransferase n=1 Tax=Dendronalium sp. ChiSLP03b TaxID=3075381 RepID=UPI002AD54C82|nr:glycosyltransferase [Dendronalium sp. ChiSLP03b]MDZ8202856.1 glycosyltransferase [Dendronalium sp. ChiSLP03b]
MLANQTNNLNNQPFLPKVSVVVPIYNGELDLPELINCLLAQTYPNDRVEYLLVDNSSRDQTAVIIQTAVQNANSQGINICYLSENKIQSSYAARNTGIRASTGEIIAFTDADCRPQPEWLYALVQAFAEPTIGFVGGTIVALPGKTIFENYAERRKILSHKDTALHPFLPYAAGANLAIRRKTLQEIGLFRPYLTTGGDADICWRIQRQSSWQCSFAEQAVLWHRHRPSLWELRKQFRRYGRSHKYLEELYNIVLFKNRWTSKEYFRRYGRWLLKELPRNTVKMILGKATWLDLFITPIDILVFNAKSIGYQEANLSEDAQKIELL